MLQERYEKDKFFEHIYNLSVEMDPELAQIDQLLEDEELYQLMRTDFAKRYPNTETTGRRSTPVEVLLRMLVVRRLYGWSYEQTEQRVRDSLVLRQFCRVYLEKVPDDTTLIRWAGQVRPETLEAFNQRIMHLAVEVKATQGRKLRMDGTVVASDIHDPQDSRQLADGVRVLGRTLTRAKVILAEKTELVKETFRNRTRSARTTARKASQSMGRNKERGRKMYRKLVHIAQTSIAQAEKVLEELQEMSTKQAENLAEVLETFIPRTQQVVAQTVRRVFEGEQVPAEEKLVSIFEAHTDIIRRGKAGKPVEYGHKVWFNEVEGGLVSHWRVLDGNPNDKRQWIPSLEAHQDLFGRPPTQVSADRGVFSQANEDDATDRGIQKVVLPKAGYKSDRRKLHEKQGWFKRGRRWHNGVEGRISVLKRKFALDRCLNYGQEGFQRWVGWGVIANNLVSIGRYQVAKSG